MEICVKSYLDTYELLIEQLCILFNTDLINNLKNESKDKKWIRGITFYKNVTNDLFDLFIQSKITVSCLLFMPKLPMKIWIKMMKKCYF